MSDNLSLWNKLGRTDPDHTKAFNRAGGFRGTAVKPVYTEQKMTEVFGPCGIGWGVTEPTFQLVPGSDGQTAVYCWLTLWFVQDGKRSDGIPGVGGDMVVVKQSSGLRTDDEAFKKAFTDAIGNAMKHLGMSADVHMGRFDDSKYVNELRDELAEEKTPKAEGRSQVKTPLNAEIEPDPDTREAMTYVTTALDIIRVHKGSESELRSWWSAEANKRREYRLSQAQVDILLGKLKERIEALTQKEPA